MVLKNKKGLAIQQLVLIILIVFSFMVIAGVVTNAIAKSQSKETELTCHNSIALRAKSQINIDSGLVKGNIKTVPVLCKTVDKKIKGSREEIKRQIADHMARCWWMFGEGRYQELLHSSQVSLLPGLLGMDELKNKCFNCYTLLINQNSIENGPISGGELIKYMWETQHPKLRNVTYLDYIQSYGGPGTAGFLTTSIQPRHAYSISVLPVVKQKGKTNWVATIGTAIGVTALSVGVVACTAATAGGCAAAVAAGGGAAKTVAVAGATAKVASVVTVGSIAVRGAQRGELPTFPIKFKDLFTEREVSSVYLSDLNIGQQYCSSGDIAGR